MKDAKDARARELPEEEEQQQCFERTESLLDQTFASSRRVVERRSPLA
jgi:hypothetical protein